MQNDTRLVFNQYTQRIAQLNKVDRADVTFSVEPSVQQTLESEVQLSSAFLGQINIVGVRDQSGQKLRLGTIGTIAGRTNTANGPRKPRYMGDLKGDDYKCEKTDFDTSIPYAKLDAWSQFPDFQTRLRDVTVKQQALDRIMIGWNGTSVAVATDRVANPLLQDVNIGWLQHIRTDAPEHIMAEVVEGSGEVAVGQGWDYENLDALVYDVTENLIDEAVRDNPNLVVICGRALLHDKYFKQINQQQDAENTLASDIIISQKQIGGLKAARVPFFPANALLVTTLDNLSIYYQRGGRRRSVRDEPDYDQIANYESSNDAYVVESYRVVALVENIAIKATAKPAG